MMTHISSDFKKSKTIIYIYFFISNIQVITQLIESTHQTKRKKEWVHEEHQNIYERQWWSLACQIFTEEKSCAMEIFFHVWNGVVYLYRKTTWCTLTWATHVTRTLIILFLWEEGDGVRAGPIKWICHWQNK